MKIKEAEQKQDFFNKTLVNWLGILCFILPLAFCFDTYDSAQIKINLFYLGSFGAFILWVCSLIYNRTSFFSKKNFYAFFPLIIYALYIICSFVFKPYHLVRLESFTRELCYFALFSVVSLGLKREDFKVLLKYFFASAWIVLGYGLMQIFDLDFLFWKNFFGNRVFSTLANPNFFGSFIVFTSVLTLFSFLIEKKKSFIVLFVLAIINLFFTESKGAWLAFAVSMVLTSGTYIYFFAKTSKENKNKIIVLSLLLLVIAGIFVSYFSIKRMQSVSFRLSTWRATWDMVQASPLTGTGIGSFEVIYPAYKRPEIFYMENIHNIETQHAENYYLENCAVLGFWGFGLLLWVFIYILKQVLFKLKTLATEKRKDALLLAGFALASASIYVHNFVDISIYFVSTGFFLFLFNAIIFNMAFGPFESRISAENESGKLFFKIILFWALVCIASIGFYIQADFWQNFLHEGHNMFFKKIYGLLFIALFISVLFVFIKVIFKVKKASVCMLVILMSFWCLGCWFQFMSYVYFSRATGLAEQRNFNSLGYYTKALSLNPTMIKIRNFRGMMLSNRLNLFERIDAFAGDKKSPSNDFKRALEDFKYAEKQEPNMALLHYNTGSLYLKYAQTLNNPQREEMLAQAEQTFKKALLLDPVYDNIYYQLANIEIVRGNREKAIYWMKEYLKGPEEVKNPEYLKTHQENEKAKKELQQLGGSL